MPPRVETKIVVNVNAIVNGLADVRALAFTVEGVGKSTTSAASGLGKFDAAMSKSQRTANNLATELRQLQRELDALNRKIARDGQFAVPSDISNASRLAEHIATRQRTLDQQNHLAAADNIRKRREAIVEAHEAERQAVIQTEENETKAAQRTFNDRAALRQAQERQRQQFAQESAKLEEKEASNFNKRIADRIARRQTEQAAATAARQKEAQAEAGSFRLLGRLAIGVLSPLKAAGNFVLGIFSQIARQIQFTVSAFLLFALATPALAFSALVSEGISFNNEMEQARIGLAALIQATHDLFRTGDSNKPLEGIEAFNAATKLAEAATNRLFIKIIPLKATSADLIPIFNQIITSATAAGLTLEETEDTFVSLAAAAQILQIPIARLGTEVRLLLAGTVRATSRLGPAIFGSSQAARDFVKEHRKIGDLFPALQIKLAAYNAALLVSTSSFAVLAENSKEVFQRLSALATSGLFERLKEAFVSITKSFFDLDAGKVKSEFVALFDIINRALGRVGDDIVELVENTIGLLQQIGTYVEQNRNDVEVILVDLAAIGSQLTGILFEMVEIVSETDEARSGVAGWHAILQVVRLVLAFLRDHLNGFIGIFQAIGGAVVAGFLAPLQLVFDLLGLISKRAAEAANNIKNARASAIRFARRGNDRALSARRDEELVAESERIANEDFDSEGRFNPSGVTRKFVPNRKNPTATDADDIQARIRNVPENAAGGGRGGEGALRHLSELRRRTRDLLEELFRTRLDIERTGEDRSFDIFKASSDRYLALLDDNLDHRLTSTLAYYQKRKELEDAAIARERKHLVDKFKLDEREAIFAIEAIGTSFDAQAKDSKNKDAAAQAEISKQRQIKTQVELNKLEERRIDLNKAILILDEKQTETTHKNNLGLEQGLETIRKTNEQIQQQLLEAQGRTTAAGIRRVAEEFRDDLLTVLSETNPATIAVAEVIENIKQLGSVTSIQLLSILDQAGVKFDDLSEETKALKALMQRLEGSAVFRGLQTEVGNKLGNLDVTRADVQDRINQGVLSEAAGRREIALAERAVRIEIEKVIELMRKLPDLTDEQSLALKQLEQQASQMGREIDELGTTINEGVKSNIESFGDSLIDDFQNLRANSRQFFTDLLQDIGKAILRAVVLKRLFDVLGLNKQGTTGAGSASGIGGVLSGIFGNTPGFAEGGRVSGPRGKDNLLARLTNEEWVIPAERVRQYGHGLMNAITTGTLGRTSVGTSRTTTNQAAVRQLRPKVVVAVGADQIANELMGSAAYSNVWLYEFNKHRNALGI